MRTVAAFAGASMVFFGGQHYGVLRRADHNMNTEMMGRIATSIESKRNCFVTESFVVQ